LAGMTMSTNLLANPVAREMNTSTRAVQKISGKVVDTQGNPIASATIALQGTAYKTQTNLQGEFSFEQISDGTKTLVISLVGYQTLEVQVQPNIFANITLTA